MEANFDYMADYREAQDSGHHADCDGYRMSHRVEIVKTDAGTFESHCEECGKLGIGSSGQRQSAERYSAGHSQEVKCDGRCQLWDAS
jgi:hypothetical protein